MPFALFILTTLISLSDSSGWNALSFSNVPPNEVDFSGETLEIEVNRSASPLLHLFPGRQSIGSLRVTGRVSGDWKFPMGSSRSQSPDDALLRLGLIENGTRKLNPLERLAAPDWIREMETQSSSIADGIGKIRCFHLMPEPKWIGETRENPNADIFVETIQASPDEDGRFEMIVELDSPLDTIGLWLLADGDDSGASFSVTIETLEVGLAR